MQGAGVGIGDQMNPDGTLKRAVYERIEAVFRSVEAREKWCKEAESVPYVAVLASKQKGTFGMGKLSPSLLGAVGMLTELHIHFDILDEQGDFSPYALLILPDVSSLSDEAIEKVDSYLRKGGSVFLSLAPEANDEAATLLGRRTHLEPMQFSLGYIRRLFKNAYDILVSRRKKLLEVQAPQNVEVSLMKKGNSYIIHFLNLNINRKGNLWEEFVPIEKGVFFRLFLPKAPKSVYYAPGELPLPRWQRRENYRGNYGILKGRVRPFDTHIMVVVEV